MPLVWFSAQDFYLMETPENLLVLQSQMYFGQKKYWDGKLESKEKVPWHGP